MAEVGPRRERGAMAAAPGMVRALEALGEGVARGSRGGGTGTLRGPPGPAGWEARAAYSEGLSRRAALRSHLVPGELFGVGPGEGLWWVSGAFPGVRGSPEGFAAGRRPGWSGVAVGRAAVPWCWCRRAGAVARYAEGRGADAAPPGRGVI